MMRFAEAPLPGFAPLRHLLRVLCPACMVALLFVVWGCNETSFVGPGPAMVFKYTGYDSTGMIVLTGSLELSFGDSAHVTGRWEFNSLGNPRQLGPQVGKGKLLGAFFQGSLIVGLNPDMVDNNVSLSGILQGNIYQGAWTWTGFAGPINRGTFRAVR